MYASNDLNFIVYMYLGGAGGRVVSAENSNVRGGGEVVSLSVMEGPGNCPTNNTCSQKLDTCHQMSSLSIIPIPDKPQVLVLMIIPLLAALQLLFTFDVEEERAAKYFFLFFNLILKRMKGGEDDPYLSRKSWWCSHI